MARLSTASAASFIASESEGWAWQIMPMSSDDPLRDGHAFFLGLVRQHRPAHHVAYGPDVGQVGPAIPVHRDEPSFIQFHAYGSGVQALGIGHPANGNDEAVDL